ncbi:hypothetical protein [Massilia luteola]|uniref:hypothetical protein n=1 Tax=Massilia luteola TaxID=3081751 RepID=UPI002ACBF23B|nr:hypothetical protein [Massilia sp. Gc5]
MKTTLFCAILLSTGLARAFDGAPTFTTKTGHVEHTLALSHWQVDARGVPSFDYVYKQHAGTCRFQLTGHAVAVYDEVNGKVELAVFNPQDASGRELPPVVGYEGDDVALTLPYKGPLQKISLRSPMPSALRTQACAKGDDEGLTVDFHK